MASLYSLFKQKITPNTEIANPEIANTEIADTYMIYLRMAKKIESLTLYDDDAAGYYIYKNNNYYFSNADNNKKKADNNKKEFLESLSILLAMEKALEIIKVLEIIKILENEGDTTSVKKIVGENKISNKMIHNFTTLVSFYNNILDVKSPVFKDDKDDSNVKLTKKILSELIDQEEQGGGKLKKGQKKIKSKKSVVSQNKENKYKDVLGKRMKIYEKPDSRKEFVRYKGELVELVEYKKSMKEIAKKTKR